MTDALIRPDLTLSNGDIVKVIANSTGAPESTLNCHGKVIAVDWSKADWDWCCRVQFGIEHGGNRDWFFRQSELRKEA